MKKRILAVLLAVCLVMALMPTAAFAEIADEEFTVDGFRYVITSADNKTVAFAKPTGNSISTYSGEITVPGTVENNNVTYTVTEIQSDAFANATGVTAVTLPDSVTSIPGNAFIGCTGLTSITFGNAVTSIGDGAFAGCSALTSLTIPDTVTSIGGGAFAGLGAPSLTIPASVTGGDAGLIGYTHLNGVTFADGSPFKLDNGVLYCGTKLVVALDRSIASCNVLDGTTSIGKYAFASGSINGVQLSGACTSLTTVTLPSSLETIEEGAFGTSTTTGSACTSLASVTFIGDDDPCLKEIGKAAFGGCTSLSTMTFPDSLTTIGESAFQKTALTSVVLPEEITEIPKGAFSQVSTLETIVIPSSVTTIGLNAFSGLKTTKELTTTIIMKGTTAPSMDNKAFGVSNGQGAVPQSTTVIVPAGSEDSYKNTILETFVTTTDGENSGISYALTLAETAEVQAGKTVTPTVTSTVPTDAELVWTSSNESVATVSEAGVVTGLKAGTATITASIKLSGVTLTSADCTVTVTPAPYIPPVNPNPSYSITAPTVDNGTLNVSPANATKDSTVTITVTPDKDYELASLTVVDANGNRVPVKQTGENKFTFTMPASKVTVNASFSKIVKELPFTDVSANDYFYDAVVWAVENGVTYGNTATTFGVGVTCNRADAVTFIWRAYGCPAPKNRENPFTDVSSSAYYADAVLWAVENGITVGTSATTFSPLESCRREHIVTFLYRAAGSPPVSHSSGFADVADSAYYANAVTWAAENGITVGAGSATTFGPTQNCFREQIVTFLYRNLAE